MGVIGDSAMAVRVYVKRNQCYRTTALILVSIYTLVWVAWIISALVVRYRHVGKVCAGDFLESKPEALDGYAIKQGSII